MVKVVRVSPAKLKAAVAYLAQQTHPGKVKLFKLLYLADFAAFAKRGSSITGETYENFEMGPVPRRLWRNLDLYAEVESDSQGGPLAEQRISAKADADMQALSEEEIAILTDVITRYGQLTGKQLRALTHAEIPYRVTQRGEEIPYALAPYHQAERPTEEEVTRLRSNPDYVARLRKTASTEGETRKVGAKRSA